MDSQVSSGLIYTEFVLLKYMYMQFAQVVLLRHNTSRALTHCVRVFDHGDYHHHDNGAAEPTSMTRSTNTHQD